MVGCFVQACTSTGAEIAIEACASSHHWARELQTREYHVKLVAAQFVKPYVKSNKNDRITSLDERISQSVQQDSIVKTGYTFAVVPVDHRISCLQPGKINVRSSTDWAVIARISSGFRVCRLIEHAAPAMALVKKTYEQAG